MKRELRSSSQIKHWLEVWGSELHEPAQLVLIGSGALLLHAAIRSHEVPLRSSSSDVDFTSGSDLVLERGYDSGVGSAFEGEHGWHINVMPNSALEGLFDWYNLQEYCKLWGAMCMWKIPARKIRFIQMYSHPEHPQRHRYIGHEEMWDAILSCKDLNEVEELAPKYGHTLRSRLQSLRICGKRHAPRPRPLDSTPHRTYPLSCSLPSRKQPLGPQLRAVGSSFTARFRSRALAWRATSFNPNNHSIGVPVFIKLASKFA